MKQKPSVGSVIAVLTREHDGTPIKTKSTISKVYGQWIYADGFPDIRWHWLDDRKSETVWRNKLGAMKIL
jgi:hypothetical protein